MADSDFTIYRDTREKRPYLFKGYPVDTEDIHMETADYAVKGDGEQTDGPFIPNFAVERKSKDDFLSSITHNRDRFERELGRASEWSLPIPVCIEAPEETLRGGDYRRDIHPNAVRGTIDSWRNQKPATFNFFDTRKTSEEFTFRLLRWHDRYHL